MKRKTALVIGTGIEVEHAVALDIGYGDLINYFRKHGKVCFGAGLGEKMETDRWWLKLDVYKIK